jgi:hypothetical protein
MVCISIPVLGIFAQVFASALHLNRVLSKQIAAGYSPRAWMKLL